MPFYARCDECDYEYTFDSERDAIESGWYVGNDYQLCDEHAVHCNECGDPVDPDYAHRQDGDYYCETCRRHAHRTCDRCGRRGSTMTIRTIINPNTHQSERICHTCRNEMRINYNRYPETTEEELMNSNGHIYQENFGEQFSRCPECIDEVEMCSRCMTKRAEQRQQEETNLWVYDTRVQQYHDGSHEKFKGLKYRDEHEHPFLYYGVELELLFNSDESIDEIAKDFIKATKGMFVAEYDRSVSNAGNGCEFISRPMSYKKWTSKETEQLLKEGFHAIQKYNPLNPQTDGCGIHVHMSRIFFERNTTKDIAKIKSDMDWIFQIFQPEIEALSRRKYTMYCASKAFKIKQQLQGNPATKFLKGKINLMRETQVNECQIGTNHHDCIVLAHRTIEIRTFKSSTDPRYIISIIELCRAIAHAARNLDLNKDTKFSDIIFAKDSNYLPDLVRKEKIDINKKFDNELEVEL